MKSRSLGRSRTPRLGPPATIVIALGTALTLMLSAACQNSETDAGDTTQTTATPQNDETTQTTTAPEDNDVTQTTVPPLDDQTTQTTETTSPDTSDVTESTAGTEPGPPDLVVTSFAAPAHEWTLSGGLSATVEIVVKNVGGTAAAPGLVAVVGMNPTDQLVPFSFPDGENLTQAVAPGATTTITGNASLSWHGHFDVACDDGSYDPAFCAARSADEVWLIAVVDHCPTYGSGPCTVNESSETNNASQPIIIPRS